MKDSALHIPDAMASQSNNSMCWTAPTQAADLGSYMRKSPLVTNNGATFELLRTLEQFVFGFRL